MYRKNKLTQDKVQKLEKIGIIWDFKEHEWDENWYEWDEMFQQLVRHKMKCGDLTPGYRPLRAWLRNMTIAMIRGNLEPHKEKLLKCIGVDKDLYKFLKKKVDELPQNNRKAPPKRQLLKPKTPLALKDEYKEVAPAEPTSWDANYEKLKSWWDNHQNYLFSQMEPHIKSWASKQCHKRRDGLLTEQQITLLSQINFPWDRY